MNYVLVTPVSNHYVLDCVFEYSLEFHSTLLYTLSLDL